MPDFSKDWKPFFPAVSGLSGQAGTVCWYPSRMVEDEQAPPDERLEILLRLFDKSWVRKLRLREIIDLLGPVDGQDFLDIVGDAPLSFYLRQTTALKGGRWTSACRDAEGAAFLEALAGERVQRIGEEPLPFENGAFDAVVVSNAMEDAASDERFVAECHRVLKPGGRLVVSVSRRRYGESELFSALKNGFDVQEMRTYARAFVQVLDAIGRRLAGRVMDGDLRRLKKAVRAVSVLYPLYWLASALDAMLFFTRGGYFIARAKRRMWVPRRTPRLRDGRSIAEAALQGKIGTAAPF